MNLPLTQNQSSLVDECDYKSLCGLKWQASFDPSTNSYYARRTRTIAGKKVTIFLAHVVCPPRPGEVVDHINGNTLDNRRCNLRSVPAAKNSMNRKLSKNNVHGNSGIYQLKQKWTAHIRVDRKKIHLGTFISKDQAIRARMNAEDQYFGEFKRLLEVCH